MNDNSVINKEISIDDNDFIQLCENQKIQSILLISPSVDKNDDNHATNFSRNVRDNTMKIMEIFSSCETMFIRLQELIKEISESDDDLFSTFHQREKSLRDVRQELGPFVWSHSYKGQSILNHLIIIFSISK